MPRLRLFSGVLPGRIATLCLHGALVCLATLLGAGSVAAEEARTPAEWIWAAEDSQPRLPVYFRRSFPLAARPAAARLLAAADFCRADVYLNGTLVAQLEPFDGRLDLDVTQRLNEGSNVLAIRCQDPCGPAALFVHLELRADDGQSTAIVSNADWHTARDAAADWLMAGETDRSWSAARSLGAVAADPWGSLSPGAAISPFDDYTQWKRAASGTPGTDPSSFLVQPGFEIELLRSAGPDEGSWVSMAFDPQGRLVLAREDRGLLRLTLPADDGSRPASIEAIDRSLEECRGLLFAHGSLYASANNSKALYRLRDQDDDGRFEDVRQLLATTGGVGHGRNDLVLGPDQRLYCIFGDSVDLPRGIADRTSPLREHRQGAQTREGFVLRLDADGGRPEIVAAGLRNPFGIDFHPDGEMFTYDADAEFDMGSPWYRPTRVNHLVSGADFGWRGVTGQWPPYFPDHPDNAPPTLDIGKGSPTAVQFGTHSRFPPPYRQSLFILDWAYGRILAVRLEPRGASYVGHSETFLRGRPLNVTDLAFGPDGAMYFVTGGRATQSAVYRVRYRGPQIAAERPTEQQARRRAQARDARAMRHRLEELHRPPADEARADAAELELIWEQLEQADPALRYAARIALEHVPLALWRDRALAEQRPWAAVTSLLALARCGQQEIRIAVLQRMLELPLDRFTARQKQAALHACSLCLGTEDSPESDSFTNVRERLADRLLAGYPDRSPEVNRQLAMLLARLRPAEALPATVQLLEAATEQSERMHYLFVLRHVRAGWTLARRQSYWQALREAEGYLGGEGMPGFVRTIREEALATLNDQERGQLAPWIDSPATADDPLEALPQRGLVREWTMDDLAELVMKDRGPRNLARGRELFRVALCSRCHRLGDQGQANGPDLTSVGSRFSRRDLLQSLVLPSLVVAENYRSSRIETVDGRVIVGRVLSGGDFRSPSLQLITDLLRPQQVTTILKGDIERHSESPVSPMPAGLLNTLDRDEIMDLLAYLESGGR
ncbi:MAG: PQQ-dependent sugar dehydrogenase [Pirellulaceae bacterium]|nr:PQQ-dependent sugar dehydrogenase [Pirellulaceae bacterium]